MASPIVSSYSGSYSIVSNSPAADGIVSLRLAIEPLFADCAVPGMCTELLHLDGLGAANAGASFGLDLGTVLSAVNDGTQLFSLSMNFGSSYSTEASGGDLGLFASVLGDTYAGQPLDSATFTIDKILFSTANSSLGFGTQATLEYTLALHAAESDFMTETLSRGPGTSSDLLVATPEPASWLLVALGAGIVYAFRSRSAV